MNATAVPRRLRLLMRGAALLFSLACLGACEPQTPPWNIVVVTFDTTRADYLAAYGNTNIRTPVIDALANDGVLFERTLTPVPITLPAHSSLMTGKVPFTHGVRDNGIFELSQDQTTLAEILQGHGYRTAAAIGSFPLTSQFGIAQGFEFFNEQITNQYQDRYGDRVFAKERLFFDERPAGRVNEAIMPWLEAHHEQPFFLWAHYFDPHHPHTPPPPYDQLYAHDGYAGEIAYADESLGVLIAQLKELGVYERTLIVFTSDHGEGNYEHNESTHSLLAYNSTLHVPLIIRAPQGARGKRVEEWTSTIDVLPTVLELLNIEVPTDIQGQSLKPYLLGGDNAELARLADREIYAETLSPALSRKWGELRSLTYRGYKYIHGPRPELFNIEQDPREINNRVEEEPEIADAMREQLQEYIDQHYVAGVDSAIHANQETLERLRGLGYIQFSGAPVGEIDERLQSGGIPPQDHAHTISAYSTAKNLLFKGQITQAKRAIQALLVEEPDNNAYLLLLVQAEQNLGHNDKVLELLERIPLDAGVGIPPQQLLDLVGKTLLALGRNVEALEKFEDAQVLNKTASGQYRIAQLYAQAGKMKQQLTHLQGALSVDPNFVAARLDLAVIKAQQGDEQMAEAQFRRVIKDNPYFSRGIYNLGAFLAQKGANEEAMALFERALMLNPQYHLARYALIEVLLKEGQRDLAMPHYNHLKEQAAHRPEYRQATELLKLL